MLTANQARELLKDYNPESTEIFKALMKDIESACKRGDNFILVDYLEEQLQDCLRTFGYRVHILRNSRNFRICW